jgi:4-amino-4-deoxy-L-arabinose transferase-like glycosyltransferase
MGIVTLFLLILRISFLDLPLERDESAYAYLGKRASEGLAPYRDYYEMKPPLLFYGYSLLNLIFGYSATGLRWAACFLTLLMCAAVYLIGRTWFGAKYGWVAALALAIFSASPRVSMVFAESELLVMSLVLFGIWFLSRLLNEDARPQQEWGYLIAAGVLLGAGVMIKQSAVFFLGFAAIVLILLATGDSWREKLLALIRRGLWFSLGAIAPVLLCLAIVLGFGVWEEFAFWNIEYPNLYTQSDTNDTAEVNLLQASFTKLIEQQVLLWVCAGLGVLALALRGLKLKLSIALLALVLFSFLTITPGQRYYLHYWIQLVPALALLIAHLFFQLETGRAAWTGFCQKFKFSRCGDRATLGSWVIQCTLEGHGFDYGDEGNVPRQSLCRGRAGGAFD